MTTPERAKPWETEYAIAAGFAASIIGCLLAAWYYPPENHTSRLVVLAVVVAAASALTRNPTACLPVALLALLFCDGFLINHYGELHWHGWPDAARLAVLAAAALTGTGIGRMSIASSARTPTDMNRPTK